MNLLEKYTPKELAYKTIKDIEENNKRKVRDIEDYHYKAISRSITHRR